MNFVDKFPVIAAVGTLTAGLALPQAVLAADPLKVGLVSFYSGPVSVPVGMPSRKGADLVI